MLTALDRYDEARSEFESLLERCKRRGEDVLLPEMHGQIARLAWIAGDGDLCRTHAQRCWETGIEVGEHLLTDTGRLMQLYPLAMAGDADVELESFAENYLADADPQGRVYAGAALGHLMVTRGDSEAACRYMDAIAQVVSSLGNRSWMFRFEGDYVEALINASRTEDARREMERLDYQARLPYARWSRAVGARCRGLLLAADHCFPEARDQLSQAVAGSTTLSQVEHGRSLLALGRLERRLKQKRIAREALTSARSAFEQTGATAWVAKADADLQRIGGRAPAGDDLTATERRIAELAADGMTNKAIAEALFISPRTVESNLTRIYRKLRVKSRIGLSSALTHDPALMPRASTPPPPHHGQG
jgi:DNA-binding CsgD family transcriptional regulator